MKRKSYLLVLLSYFMFVFYGFSQNNKVWISIDKNSIKENILSKKISVLDHKTYRLNLQILKNKLLTASEEREITSIEFPNNEGKLVRFKIKETSILHPELAAKYPSIKSFVGRSLGKTKETVYFSISPLGLYAMILSPEMETTYIDPYTRDSNIYMVYSKKNAQHIQNFECLTQNVEVKKIVKKFPKNANDLKLRTFRLALATTEEYSNFHINQAGLGAGSTRTDSITVVLAAITTTITRVNAIFERDVALTMQLIPNNDQLLFLETDPGNDPYSNNNKQLMLDQNQTTINTSIGIANYDIGHVFSFGGGGIAYLGSACGGGKAGGVTGASMPLGDPFDIDYVSHEMGHQFGANHTFNSTASNCGNGNRNSTTAIEPGSGSTIMGYAGICAPENVQSHSDAYFHSISINEIVNNITNGNSQCAVQTNFTSNLHVPITNAGGDFTIPKSTPFALKGQGSDVDGNQLTFCWEQTNTGVLTIQVPPSSTQTEGAVFRSMSPILSPKRYLPTLPAVILGGNSVWEVLPSVSRILNFDFTVRDNVAGEGQTATDDMTVTVIDNAGPFIVTSQNSQGISWTPSDTETISWDVAGTDINAINVSHVNILLSLDGGITFPITLASNTPNDGQEQIIVPSSTASEVRVMVEAVNNIFFAVNGEPFSIGSFTTTCLNFESNDTPIDIPDNNFSGIESTLNIVDDFSVIDANVTVDISHTWIRDLQIFLKAPSGTEVLLYDRSCGDSNTARININATFNDEAVAAVCNNSNPAISGETKPDNLLSIFNGLSSFGDWKLRVVDNASQDTGVLNSWSLQLCETKQTVGVGDYLLQNLKVYPNPFLDTLHISFTSDLIDSVFVTLYDISGRVIFMDKERNTGSNYTNDLDVSKLASGIYILSVKQGSQKASKKVIKY